MVLAMHTKKISSEILSVQINNTSYREACDRIQILAQAKQSSYIVAANVHVVMTAYWCARYRNILNNAALITPDGMPLVMGMRWLGVKNQPRVYGPDLMLAWCDRAAATNLSIYLYGSTPQTLQKLSDKLQTSFPTLKIAGTHSPPFRALTPAEDAADIDRIRRSGAAVVFVGLGCPKQEEWMHRQMGKLEAVMIGVGAAFRFHSGEVAQAPSWMMKTGLEWCFRLAQEPRRLWQRYLTTNLAFVFLFSGQLLQHHLNRYLQLSYSHKTPG